MKTIVICKLWYNLYIISLKKVVNKILMLSEIYLDIHNGLE